MKLTALMIDMSADQLAVSSRDTRLPAGWILIFFFAPP
jgi:hypothetical protein